MGEKCILELKDLIGREMTGFTINNIEGRDRKYILYFEGDINFEIECDSNTLIWIVGGTEE